MATPTGLTQGTKMGNARVQRKRRECSQQGHAFSREEMVLDPNGQQVLIPRLHGGLPALSQLLKAQEWQRHTFGGSWSTTSSGTRFIFTPWSLNQPLWKYATGRASEVRASLNPRVEQQKDGLLTQLTRCLIRMWCICNHAPKTKAGKSVMLFEQKQNEITRRGSTAGMPFSPVKILLAEISDY